MIEVGRTYVLLGKVKVELGNELLVRVFNILDLSAHLLSGFYVRFRP